MHCCNHEIMNVIHIHKCGFTTLLVVTNNRLAIDFDGPGSAICQGVDAMATTQVDPVTYNIEHDQRLFPFDVPFPEISSDSL